MKYDPAVHHRRSIRLQGYDYSKAGVYFVTICTQNRECLFGKIVDGEMRLNDAGEMVRPWYFELENKFSDIQCDAFVCMPNHIHFIVVNVGADLRVRPNVYATNADLRVRPNVYATNADLRVRPNVYATNAVCPETVPPKNGQTHGFGQTHRSAPTGDTIMDEHIGSPLHRVVQWFKTMTTNDYICGVKQNGWPPFPGKLWQRNYWEHIVRNELELNRIREYIGDNPAKWEMDKLFIG